MGQKVFRFERSQSNLFMNVGLAITLAMVFLPWDKWFPGTAIYATDASFIVRNAALISLVGTVATIAGLLLAIVLNFRHTKPIVTAES